MKKSRIAKSVAAVASAAVIASQLMAVTVSAANDYYYYYDGVYYSEYTDAAYEAGNDNVVAVPAKYVVGETKYYSTITHKIYDTEEEAKRAGKYYHEVIVPYTTTYSYMWYSSYTNKYYTTYEAALAASLGKPEYVSYGGYSNYYSSYYYNLGYRYYNIATGKYYKSYEAAVAASKASDVVYIGNYSYYYNYGSSVSYYSTVTKKYYTSYEAALKASNGDESCVITVYGSAYNGTYGGQYYSTYTGKYYATYEEALAASKYNPSYVILVDGVYNSGYKYYYRGVGYPTLAAAIEAGGTALGVDIYYLPENSDRKNYYYYYNGKYYSTLSAAQAAGGTAIGYDIFYVPYGTYGHIKTDKDDKDDSSSNKKAPENTPYVYGKSTKYGWDTIIKYLDAASKGETVTVDMNGSYIVSGKALDAIEGRNVNLVCVLDNGVKWTINGKDVDTKKDINIYTEYNIKYVPSSLIKKATKDAVSYTQVGISTKYVDFDVEANVTVKFAAKRAGLTAVVYKYDPDSNSLKGVCKSKVLSDGSCTFTVDQGAAYVIILK
ncbi:MAG: hypothetical protein ACI4JJ_08920 [Huintestinicola sp.]